MVPIWEIRFRRLVDRKTISKALGTHHNRRGMVEIQLLDLLKTALNLDRRYTGYKMVYNII